MPKLRIVYILSLLILGVLVIFTVFRPMALGKEYSEVQRAQLLERADRWVIELHLVNHQENGVTYTINVLVGDELCTESIWLGQGELFKYNHHIPCDGCEAKNVSVTIYEPGDDTPLEQITYYLR